MDKITKAQALRDAADTHYNCAQAVVMACAEECGLTDEAACRLAAHFGGGMRCGATCGAVTGALMVLGMAGKDEAAAKALVARFKEKNTHLDCVDLLRKAAAEGEGRKLHCDRMVCDAVTLIEELLP